MSGFDDGTTGIDDGTTGDDDGTTGDDDGTTGDDDDRSSRSARSPVWVLLIALFAVIAVAGPVKMATRDDGDGGGSAGTVRMAGLRFSPATLTVREGTRVLFDNNDVAPHTVTGRGSPVRSGIRRPGQSFELVVRERFDYACDIHPAMKASVEISA